MNDHETSFGVFKPVGQLVISFPGAEAAAAAALAMEAAGVSPAEIQPYTDQQMLAQTREDIANASPLAAIGQELNLVLAHRVLAEQGYHFLVVRAPDGISAQTIAGLARDNGALRAQLYGRFIIEEMIERPEQLPQVAESPDRGLDAQTPSGLESEAGSDQRARVARDKADRTD